MNGIPPSSSTGSGELREQGHDALQKQLHVLQLFMVCLSAGFYSLAADAPSPLLVAATLGGLSLFVPRIPVTPRSVVYGGIVVLLLVLACERLVPISPERFFIMPGHLMGQILVAAASMTLLLRPNRFTRCLHVLLVLGLVAVCANIVPNVASLKRLLWLKPLNDVYWHAFLFVLVATLTGCWLLIRRLPPRGRFFVPQGWAGMFQRARWISFSLILSCGLLVLISKLSLRYEQLLSMQADRWVSKLLSQSELGFSFRDVVDVNYFSYFRGRQDDTILIRARAPVAPGYLRARCYTTYVNGTWTAETNENAPLLQLEERHRLRVFSRIAATLPRQWVADFYLSPALNGQALPVPNSCTDVALLAEQVMENTEGSLTAQEWDNRLRYEVFTVEDHARDDAYRWPTQGRLPRYQQIPTWFSKSLDPVYQEFVEKCGPPGSVPDARRVTQVEQFLQARCSYSLGAPYSYTGMDPALVFLKMFRKGHCELFATAAVMLLRKDGIPARYVTGMVCQEPVGDDYWVARLRDAHAWGEAWLTDERRWVMVEATPADGQPRTLPVTTWKQWSEKVDFFVQRLVSWLKTGGWRDLLAIAGSGLLHGFIWLVSKPWRLLLALLFLLSFLANGWWRKQQRQRELQRKLTWGRYHVRQEWLRFEKRLARQHGPRAPSQTPREYAAALPVALREPWLRLVDAYETLRFHPQPPSPDEARAFTRRLRQEARILKSAPNQRP